MKSRHTINLIQKFQLERVGYDEYYKCEYAKLNKQDIVVRTYQLICNELTDRFRSHCLVLPLPQPDEIINVASIIASTDVLEYLMRKKELLLLNRFGQLANLGIVTFKQLCNEITFPSSDWSRELAIYLVKFFPPAWPVLMSTDIDYNSDLSYEYEFPAENLQLHNHNQVTVKSIRKTLLESLPIPPKSYDNYEKFGMIRVAETRI
jgi:hypothetical protein